MYDMYIAATYRRMDHLFTPNTARFILTEAEYEHRAFKAYHLLQRLLRSPGVENRLAHANLLLIHICLERVTRVASSQAYPERSHLLDL
jgi:hypothetical protein